MERCGEQQKFYRLLYMGRYGKVWVKAGGKEWDEGAIILRSEQDEGQGGARERTLS
jgi:hypothetical protein